jgi:putative ABC transport system permease protein
MLGIIFKNMLKYKVLTICLIAGFMLSSVIVSAIPIYSKAVLYENLQYSFQTSEKTGNTEENPQSGKKKSDPLELTNEDQVGKNMLWAMQKFKYNDSYKNIYNQYVDARDKLFAKAQDINIPINTKSTVIYFRDMDYEYNEGDSKSTSHNNKLIYIQDIEKHIKLLQGQFPGNTMNSDGSIDIMVDEKTFEVYGLKLGGLYEMTSIYMKNPPHLKIAGVFQKADEKDLFWTDNGSDLYCSLVTSEGVLWDFFKKNESYNGHFAAVIYKVSYAYDKLHSDNAKDIYNIAKEMPASIENRLQLQVYLPMINVIKAYLDKEVLLTTILWIFLIPVLVVVLYYVVMVCRFLAEYDRDQIGILKSRGVGMLQIMSMYFYEGLFISAVSFIAGPILAYFLCRQLGYVDGFLKFRAGSPLEVDISADVYKYLLMLFLVLMATLLTSVYFYARQSIVEIRRSKNRKILSMVKMKNLDIILLIISLYGYYLYCVKGKSTAFSSIGSKQVPVDPLMYMISTLFIISFSMLLIRLYKYLTKFLFFITRDMLPSSLYISFINTLRYHLKSRNVMIFVSTTVALGIFNVKVAKNINESFENTIRYKNGADIVSSGLQRNMEDQGDAAGSKNSDKAERQYIELYRRIPVSNYLKVDGIQGATKVYKSNVGSVYFGTSGDITSVRAIIPHEFGDTAWFDSSLTKPHWYYDLNDMTANPKNVLISKGLSDKWKVYKGEEIDYCLEPDGIPLKGIVADVIQYWPGEMNLNSRIVIISNYKYVFSHMPERPYEVWMKKKEGFTNAQLYDSLKKLNIEYSKFDDADKILSETQRDLFLKGTNSSLTLGFLSIMVITFIGFLLYWMMSLKNRTLQFGIFRAIGISSRYISKMLILEQLLTFAISVLIGVISGKVSALLFLDFIIKLWFMRQFSIPVNNLSYLREYAGLAIILGIVLATSLLILKRYISRLKINQALKLGED